MLREKLLRLKASLGDANLPQNYTIKDEDFVVALKKIENETSLISEKVKSMKKSDDDLREFFDKLRLEFSRLKQGLSNLKMVYKMAFNDSKTAMMDIGDAEDIIEQIKKLLADAMYQLNNHGVVAYHEALKLARDISDLAKSMKTIAADVSLKFLF